MDIEAELEKIFAEDDLGLLDIKPKVSRSKTADQRLVDSFAEINAFIDQYGTEPAMSGGIIEQRLAFRLDGIRNDPKKSAALQDVDCYHLLEVPPPKEYHSMNDILTDDDAMGLLDVNSQENSIFSLKHVKAPALPDYISKRKPCKNFGKFEALFKKCQQELSCGKREILPFRNGIQIHAGDFFVLSGVLLYVDKVGQLKLNTHRNANGRTHCIFENGTESDMLLRSLSTGLYKDGRRVSEPDEKLLDGFADITADDTETGYIYILKSRSQDPRIQSIANLYKIGFSTEPVEVRIQNAEKEPTYLMAAVEIVDTFRCFNLNPQKLEALLHTFFGHSCLDIDIFDAQGVRHVPREWFIAPYQVIRQAIYFILNGEIIHYRYDADKEEIVNRE